MRNVDPEIDIKPCPFCGCGDIGINENDHGDCYIVCEKCACRTSEYLCKERYLAIEDWNRREIKQ